MTSRARNRKQQVVRVFTNGRRAESAHALADHVGQVVRRRDQVAQRAVATMARRVGPLARRHVQAVFNVQARTLAGKFSVRTTSDSLRVYAFQRRIPLMVFAGQWRGVRTPGATAMVERGRRETYASSFIAAVGKARLRSIRVRSTAAGRRVPRGPLEMLYGPSPYDMVVGYRRGPLRHDGVTGRYPHDLRALITADTVALYATELRRQYAVEAKRGR